MNKCKLSNFIEFDPSEKLEKNQSAKKVSMDCLMPYTREITSYCVSKYSGGAKFRNCDTIVARITPCLENGKTAYVNILKQNEVAFGSTEFIVLRSKDRISDSKFIYYLSISEWFRNIAIKSMVGSSGRQRVQKNVLQETLFNLPPLEEQKAIADVLASLDDKIELNNKINKNLEEQAQALFKRWFVDFEFPNEDSNPYKSSGGEMVDSELGLIPKGWKVCALGDLTDCILGGTPSRAKAEFWNGDIPWINSGKINEYRIVDATEFISKQGLQFSATKLLQPKTVVLAITGATLGQISILEIESCANQSVVGIVNNAKIPYEFCYLMLVNRMVDLLSHQTGGAQQHINKDNIENFQIIYSEKVVNQFKDRVRAVFEKISVNCFENQKLAELRDYLLPKLMSGEIRVKQ